MRYFQPALLPRIPLFVNLSALQVSEPTVLEARCTNTDERER